MEIGALEEAERELMMIDKDLKDAELVQSYFLLLIDTTYIFFYCVVMFIEIYGMWCNLNSYFRRRITMKM